MRGLSLKLHHFRDAVAIAEHGSLRAAARHLGIAQPTLARGLSELERGLGAPLFERRSRVCSLTPLGPGIRETSDRHLERCSSGRGRIRATARQRLSVRLPSASLSPRIWLLPKVLEPFRRKFPKSTCILLRGFIQPLHRAYDGGVDFYVGLIRAETAASSSKEVLLPGRRAVLCRSKHPLANATSLKELIRAEWVTTSITPRAAKELGVLFRNYGLPEPTLAMRVQSALTLFDVSHPFRPSRHGARADGRCRHSPIASSRRSQ